MLGIGEIGLNRITRNEIATYTEQVELALAHRQLILIHTPHLEDKLKGTRISVDVLNGFPSIERERVMVDHAEEHTIEMILDHGYWAGLTLYPQDQGLGRARRRHDREIRPGADLRGRRLRLGPERCHRRAALRHGDAPPPPSETSSFSRVVFENPVRVPQPVAEVQDPARRAREASLDRASADVAVASRVAELLPRCASIPTDSLHLTYCTNIHPADGWDAVLRQPPARTRRR